VKEKGEKGIVRRMTLGGVKNRSVKRVEI